MSTSTNSMNRQQLDRYSEGRWSEVQRKVEEIRQAHAQGGVSEAELHRLADQLRELLGGASMATKLIPLIMAEHRKSVEWGLERLLVSARQLEDLPYVEPVERGAVEQRIGSIIRKVDRGELDAAEALVRDVELRVEQLRVANLETEFDKLLGSIGEIYQTV